MEKKKAKLPKNSQRNWDKENTSKALGVTCPAADGSVSRVEMILSRQKNSEDYH